MKAGIVKNFIDTYREMNICMCKIFNKTDYCNYYKNYGPLFT